MPGVRNIDRTSLDAAKYSLVLRSSRRFTALQADSWSELGVDDLATMYDSEITAILDRTIPACTDRAVSPLCVAAAV